MKLSDYLGAMITDLKAHATFLKDVATHGKIFGATELQQMVLTAPAARIALIGARGGSAQASVRGARRDVMGRADTGQFRGPLQMIAFLIERDFKNEEARDRVIRLADDFMYFIEHRWWGLSRDVAGPVMVTGFEIQYSAEIDQLGAAIAAVSFEQEVVFGRSLHDEDMALLTGDKYGLYPSGQQFWSEKEWADKGVLTPEQPPLAKGTADPMFTGEGQPDSEDHEPVDINE